MAHGKTKTMEKTETDDDDSGFIRKNPEVVIVLVIMAIFLAVDVYFLFTHGNTL
jgi:hypothetical protein